MAVIISMLRGVNVGGHKKVKMDALCTLCGSLGLRDAQTYVQSGNVIFRTEGRDLARLRKRIEDGIEKTFGFHSDVILRTPADLRDDRCRKSIRIAERHRAKKAHRDISRQRSRSGSSGEAARH